MATLTSAALSHLAMMAGRRLMLAFQTSRASSYPASGGSITGPLIARRRSATFSLAVSVISTPRLAALILGGGCRRPQYRRIASSPIIPSHPPSRAAIQHRWGAPGHKPDSRRMGQHSATFLLLGQHLRPMLIAWQDPGQLTEYASSPTPFWLVKLMDLGIIVPSLVVTGVGLWRRTGWTRRVAYVLLTGYTGLAVS